MNKLTGMLAICTAALLVFAPRPVFGFGKKDSSKMDAQAPKPETPSLEDAIKRSAEEIADGLPQGSRVVIAWKAPSADLPEYIMEELIRALADRGMKAEAADQPGDVNAESLLSLEADMAVTGQLTTPAEPGGGCRFSFSVYTKDKKRGSESGFDARVDGVSLADAVKQSAENITAGLSREGRVAVVAWGAPNTNLQDYIMRELNRALVGRGAEAAAASQQA